MRTRIGTGLQRRMSRNILGALPFAIINKALRHFRHFLKSTSVNLCQFAERICNRDHRLNGIQAGCQLRRSLVDSALAIRFRFNADFRRSIGRLKQRWMRRRRRVRLLLGIWQNAIES